MPNEAPYAIVSNRSNNEPVGLTLQVLDQAIDELYVSLRDEPEAKVHIEMSPRQATRFRAFPWQGTPMSSIALTSTGGLTYNGIPIQVIAGHEDVRVVSSDGVYVLVEGIDSLQPLTV